MFECKAFTDERDAFLARLCSICPYARHLTDECRLRLLTCERRAQATTPGD